MTKSYTPTIPIYLGNRSVVINNTDVETTQSQAHTICDAIRANCNTRAKVELQLERWEDVFDNRGRLRDQAVRVTVRINRRQSSIDLLVGRNGAQYDPHQ